MVKQSSSPGWFNIGRSTNIIYHINNLKEEKTNKPKQANKQKPKNHMIISFNAENIFDKIQHAFMLKVLIRNSRDVPKHNSVSLQLANSQYQPKWRKHQSSSTKIRNKNVLHSLHTYSIWYLKSLTEQLDNKRRSKGYKLESSTPFQHIA